MLVNCGPSSIALWRQLANVIDEVFRKGGPHPNCFLTTVRPFDRFCCDAYAINGVSNVSFAMRIDRRVTTLLRGITTHEKEWLQEVEVTSDTVRYYNTSPKEHVREDSAEQENLLLPVDEP